MVQGASAGLPSPANRSLWRGKPTSRWDLLTLVLSGVLILYVWRIQEVFPVLAPFQLTALASVGAIVLFALDSQRSRRVAHLRHPLYRPIAIIFVLAVLSIPASLHAGASFRFLTSNFIKTVLLVGILAASIRDRRDVERLVRVFVLGGAGYVLASIALGASDGGRLAGQGSYDPNDLGLFTVSTIPLCAYLMRRGAGAVNRLIGMASAILLLVGTVQTGSRGGFLGLVAVAGFGLLAMNAVRSSKRVAIMTVAVTVMFVAGSDAYWERMKTILAPQQDYNWSGGAESGRMEVWKRGLGYMMDRPLVGVGVDQFNVAEGTLAPQAARQSMGIGFKWSAAHSSYVQIGAELGVLGLGAFVALLLLAFREGWRIGRVANTPADRLLGQAFCGLIVGYAIGGAFLSQAYSTYLYFALGLLIGFSRVVGREGHVETASAAPAVSMRGMRGALSGVRPAAASRS